MASDSWQVQVELSEEFKDALQKTEAELIAAREALSEDRIRQIVREELATWEKRMVQMLRFGTPSRSEVK